MVTTGILPLQGIIPMVEPGMEHGTSWLVVRSSDHQTTRLVNLELKLENYQRQFLILSAKILSTLEFAEFYLNFLYVFIV